jgi:glutaconate CoA-transferase, subunit B
MPADTLPPSPGETMIVASARELAGERVCFVGIGPPNIACNLARRTVAPDLELVYEAGVFGAVPARLPLSIGDPTLVTGATAVSSMFEMFAYYLQGGLVDVAFLSGSQIDRWGNLNTTVIGDYKDPKVRLPGSGGACEIAINARKVFVIMPQSTRSFVDKIDFVTSPGHLAGKRPKEWIGAGPSIVITGLGIYEFDSSGEMYLSRTHPGVTIEEARTATGWDLKIADDVHETPAPTAEELHLMRDVLDPQGIYTRSRE